MEQNRYKAVLSRRLPSNAYSFRDMNTAHPYVLMAAKTNSGNLYTLRVDLTSFPMSVPKVFVNRMLTDCRGKELSSASSSMHTLASENRQTRICHYGSLSWTPNVSIYKIYVKCRLWLEMYEAHLRTGLPIDHYLNHQS